MPSTIKRVRLSHKKTARQKCLFFTNPKIRKRVFISTLATFTLKDFLTEQGLKVNEGEAYCDNFFLSEGFDIADIKVGNANIDVRCIVNNQYTQLWIPKKPYEFGYIFDFYVAVSLDTTKDRAEIVGYVSHDDIKDSLEGNPDKINYYVFDASILKPPLELASAIIPVSKAKKGTDKFSEEDHDVVQELFTAFLDNDLGMKELTFFQNHIRNCESCKETLMYFHLFDKKIKAPKIPLVFLDESVSVEDAYATPELSMDDEVFELKEDDVFDEADFDEEFEDITELESVKSPLEKAVETRKAEDKKIKELQKEEKLAFEEPEEEIHQFAKEEFAPIVEEAKAEPKPFRRDDQKQLPEIIEAGEKVDIQPEESFLAPLPEPPKSSWETAYQVSDTVFTEPETKDELGVFGDTDISTEEIFATDEESLWQQYPTEGDVWHESFSEPEEYSTSELLKEGLPQSVEEPLYKGPVSLEEFEELPVDELSTTETLDLPGEAFADPSALPDQEQLLAEARAAEDYINAKLSEAGLDTGPAEEEFPDIDKQISFDETTSDEELSFDTHEAEELQTYEPSYDYPSEELPDSGELTLESLEEEHIDTLESYDGGMDLDSLSIQLPSAGEDLKGIDQDGDSSVSDEEFSHIEYQPPESLTPEAEMYQPGQLDTSGFEYIDGFGDERPVPPYEEYGEATEQTDGTLEDLEKEFDSIASFNFEDISATPPGIEPVIQDTRDIPSYQETGLSSYEPDQADQPEMYDPGDLFDVSKDIEGMFDTPHTSADNIFASEQKSLTGFEDDTEEEIIMPDDYSTTSVDTSYQRTSSRLQGEVDQLFQEFEEDESGAPEEYQPHSEYIPIDQSIEESIVPSDQELTDLKGFVESKKRDAKKEKKKAKKGGFKKLVLLAASLLLIGGVVAGVVVIGPKLGGMSKDLMASLPKFESKQELSQPPGGQLPPPPDQPTQESQLPPETEVDPNAAPVTPADDVSTNSTVTDHVSELDKKVAIETSAPQEAEGEKAPVTEEKKVVKTSEPEKLTLSQTNEKAVTAGKSQPQPQPQANKQERLLAATPAGSSGNVSKPPAPPKAKMMTAKPVKPAPKDSGAVRAKADIKAQPVAPPPADNDKLKINKPVILQTSETIAMEDQSGASFLPERSREIASDRDEEGFIAAGFSTTKKEALPPANPVIAGLEEKEETLKTNLNPGPRKLAATVHSTSANVYWKPATSRQISTDLKNFINSSTQQAKSIINTELKTNEISGQLRSTVILVKINNSTNSIIASIVSSSGSSRVDNLILNSVRKSFSTKSLPKSSGESDTVQINITVAL